MITTINNIDHQCLYYQSHLLILPIDQTIEPLHLYEPLPTYFQPESDNSWI